MNVHGSEIEVSCLRLKQKNSEPKGAGKYPSAAAGQQYVYHRTSGDHNTPVARSYYILFVRGDGDENQKGNNVKHFLLIAAVAAN
jgi:hypothetical protein